jgi:hypothetical protein
VLAEDADTPGGARVLRDALDALLQRETPLDPQSPYRARTINADQVARGDRVRASFERLDATVRLLVPPGRERSIVLTHLEEACMMAVAGIARMHDVARRTPG